MAKATVTVAVIVFFFAVAHARFPLDLAVNKAVATVDEDPVTVLPEPDFKTNLLLPSEKPETKPESTAIVAWEPDTVGAELTKPESSPEKTDSDAGENSKSLTVISIRPINSGRYPRLPFSFPGRRCRMHHRAEGRRVSGRRGTGNGKGMVLADHRQRQFPGRLMRLRNPGLRNGMFNGKDTKMRHRHSYRNHQHRHTQNHHHVAKNKERHHEHKQPEHVHEHEHEHVKKQPEAFVMKIRKFLMTSF